MADRTPHLIPFGKKQDVTDAQASNEFASWLVNQNAIPGSKTGVKVSDGESLAVIGHQHAQVGM
ncbi:hypothetical protein [Stieleria neptunia]|uniref:hypothetical protein n=1 Tax=Stieleria neptunia TaxID=2527979 RepID=UPI0011A82475|nr:hypothetical protein [Stieleria neptunia]